MFKDVKKRFRNFRRNEEGTIVAEAVVMFPLLFASVIAMFVFFDAFRHQSMSLQAVYTISDAVSREGDERSITANFIENSWRLHRFLSRSPALTDLQISLIQYDEVNDAHRVVWSESRGALGDLTQGGLDTLVVGNLVPVMPDLGSLIVVQSSVNYTPNFSIGLQSFNFDATVFTSPRYAAQLCYSENGDIANRICPTDAGI